MAAQELRYRAFLSYAHADARWGRWVHKQLEGYRIEKDLVGQPTPLGPVPATLRPIFRDREDFSGGHTLTEATIATLDDSAALIVVCSAVAATRPAVNEEVRLFRSRHPRRPVIPIVIDGNYPDNFPPALRFAVTSAGTITGDAVTILGPDLREAGDGRSLGISKVVAGLTGVRTDDIVRRAERARRRQLRNWIAGLSTIVIALTGLSIWAELNRREAVQQRKEAERNFGLAKTAADDLVYDIAQGLRDIEGLRTASVTKILGTAQKTFDKLANAVPNNFELQRSRQVMLNEFGRTQLSQGNATAALESFLAARDIGNGLLNVQPDSIKLQRDTSVSLINIGDARNAQGDLSAALNSFKVALLTATRRGELDPNNVEWQRDLAAIYDRIGRVLQAQGDLTASLDSFLASLRIAERLALNPANTDLQRVLSVAHRNVGGIYQLQNNLPMALEHFGLSLKIDNGLVSSEPERIDWHFNLANANELIASALASQGDRDSSRDHYQAALTILERLMELNRDDVRIPQSLSELIIKIGDFIRDGGDYPTALEYYQRSLDIIEHPSSVNPGNFGLTQLTVTSLLRIGYVSELAQRREHALASYQRAEGLLQILSRLSPENTRVKQDLSWVEGRVTALKYNHGG